MKKKTEISKELEKQYKDSVKEMNKLIKEQMQIAKKAIREVEKISEKYGLPVNCDVTPINMSYIPKSKNKKWKKLFSELEKIDEYNDCPEFLLDLKYSELSEKEDPGWEFSAVCW